MKEAFCLSLLLILTGCTGQQQGGGQTVPSKPRSDPQQCLNQAECTTKTSRTLLFIFDYAAAGGALVQRQQRLLFTPADAPRGEWPALYIHLAEPTGGRFDFNAQCQTPSCRYSAAQLLQIYRAYLAGQPGGLPRP